MASHWRLLDALFGTFKIESVLETGSGDYSTRMFLRRGCRVVSLENDPEWQRDEFNDEHELVKVDGPIAPALPNLDEFDLVFVDDDPVVSRVDTIRAAIDNVTGLLVIHDTDYHLFARELETLPHFTDRTSKPHTSVVWPTKALQRLIPSSAGDVDPDQ